MEILLYLMYYNWLYGKYNILFHYLNAQYPDTNKQVNLQGLV